MNGKPKLPESTDGLTVRGFRQKTLDTWQKSYGSPVSADQSGYMSISPENRDILGVHIGQIIEAVRADIDGAIGVKVKITPGVPEYVALTGTARDKLGGLVNEKKETEPKREGDRITLKRNGNRIEVRKAA